ncbi:hypothetical protein BDP27DRAFT_1367863 [Rhodocollybia butyracea]|uniref:Uncharacterized protein n=1 Tax=Rhodocollybia butyracea TaxID=206335 RepID=A0A9P5PJ76_9AGAR|nr:hypothetical protein BDP27DRAFT_1367863 [Rhodocollybia butyracea]
MREVGFKVIGGDQADIVGPDIQTPLKSEARQVEARATVFVGQGNYKLEIRNLENRGDAKLRKTINEAKGYRYRPPSRQFMAIKGYFGISVAWKREEKLYNRVASLNNLACIHRDKLVAMCNTDAASLGFWTHFFKALLEQHQSTPWIHEYHRQLKLELSSMRRLILSFVVAVLNQTSSSLTASALGPRDYKNMSVFVRI